MNNEIQLTKKSWKSKTLWVALINAAVAFIPPVHELIVKNPEMYAMILSGVFAALRIVTKGRVSIS